MLAKSTTQCPKWEVTPDNDSGFQRNISKVVNSVYGAARRKQNLTSELNLDIHRRLFKAVVPVKEYAGNYRQDDQSMPCLAKTVEINGIKGAPFSEVILKVETLFNQHLQLLDSFEHDFSSLDSRRKVERLALIVGHFVGEFIRIHPHINGNGTLSRIFWGFLLVRFGVKPKLAIKPRPKGEYPKVMAEAMVGNNALIAAMVVNHIRGAKYPECKLI